MIPRPTIRFSVCTLLSGVLLAACGGIPEAEPIASAEPLGTRELALCSGLGVSSLTSLGISSYQGELASSGAWAVTPGANAIRLEYYVDGVLRSTDERLGTSGNWYVSASGMSCGWHTLETRAYPMVVDSAGTRTTCLDSPYSLTQSALEYCTPTSTLSCRRSTASTITCSGNASLGSGVYTPYWQDVWTYGGEQYSYGWNAGPWKETFYCASPIEYPDGERSYLTIQFKVIDSTGASSNVSIRTSYVCMN